jgi:hypothetical protein
MARGGMGQARRMLTRFLILSSDEIGLIPDADRLELAIIAEGIANFRWDSSKNAASAVYDVRVSWRLYVDRLITIRQYVAARCHPSYLMCPKNTNRAASYLHEMQEGRGQVCTKVCFIF